MYWPKQNQAHKICRLNYYKTKNQVAYISYIHIQKKKERIKIKMEPRVS